MFVEEHSNSDSEYANDESMSHSIEISNDECSISIKRDKKKASATPATSKNTQNTKFARIFQE